MNYYGVTRSTDHLAHYGVKGMKWGVRRALASGNEKALDKYYRKAAKKLAKLQDIGLNSPKYAAKAAAYGAAAAGTGTVARLFPKWTQKFVPEVKSKPTMTQHALGWWPNKTERIPEHFENTTIGNVGKYVSLGAHAGALGLAGLNAYRAASGPKYREKAVNWKKSMDDAFKGTKYSGVYDVPEKKKRRVKHSDNDYATTFDAFSDPDFLSHYGIKGMKWGVRKAIERGNQRALDRQYRKAAKKLEKLSKRADIEAQNQQAQKYNKIAKKAGKIGATGAAIGLVGTGTDHTLRLITGLRRANTKYRLRDVEDEMRSVRSTADNAFRYHNGRYNEELKEKKLTEKILPEKKLQEKKIIEQKYQDNMDKVKEDLYREHGALEKKYDDIHGEYDKIKDRNHTIADIGRYAGYAGAGIGALGLGTAAISKAKAHAAKKRTTAEGHAKAVAERDAWKKEMQSAFKGTKYSNIPKIQKKRRKAK